MKLKNLLPIFVPLAILLSSCGGGGGTQVAAVPGVDGSGDAPIIIVGAVSGLGSVILNGVTYDDSTAKVTIEDADEDSIKVGMVARLSGTLKSDKVTGKAEDIQSGAELRGPVDSVDAASKAFVALGTTVKMDAATVFVNIAADLSNLQVGDSVQVNGVLDASGAIKATRVQTRPPQSQAVLKTVGIVAPMPAPTATSFKLGALTINYTASVVRDVATPLVAGTQVRVKLAGLPVSGVATATQIRPVAAPLVATLPNTKGEVQGAVSDLVGDNFKVAGLSAQLTANTTFERGVRADLANGRLVEVKGTINGSVLVVDNVKFEDVSGGGGGNEFRFQGPVTNFASVSDFQVKGQRIDASQNPQVSPGGRSVNDIANGVNVEVRGTQIVNDKLIATRVQFK